MNNSTEIIKNLLKQFEDDINDFKFDGIYENIIYHEFQFKGITGKLTSFLLKAGINPFKYTDKVLCRAAMDVDQDIIELSNKTNFIGQQAFEKSSIQEIIIPAPVTKIEDYAFRNCFNLNTVIFEGNNDIDLGYGIFMDCDLLINIRLPDNLKNIPIWMFKNCKSLTSIEIPSTVREIGKNAFYGCESLKYVKFLGKKDDFDYIRIEDLYYPDGFAKWVPTIKCTDGEYILYED